MHKQTHTHTRLEQRWHIFGFTWYKMFPMTLPFALKSEEKSSDQHFFFRMGLSSHSRGCDQMLLYHLCKTIRISAVKICKTIILKCIWLLCFVAMSAVWLRWQLVSNLEPLGLRLAQCAQWSSLKQRRFIL